MGGVMVTPSWSRFSLQTAGSRPTDADRPVPVSWLGTALGRDKQQNCASAAAGGGQREREPLILRAAMEASGPAAPLILLALILPGISAGRCNMTGIWWNDLGSSFYLSEAENLTLSGRYRTAVEAAAGEAGADRQAPVVGIRHGGREPTFTMSTAWAGGSITSWVGQCLILEDGHQILKTMWLLRSPVASLQDDWKSTRIGQDTFHQTARDVLSKNRL
ncbi:avidin-like [Pristis pectinata]|uniref:avidin-like n=1 Tax=Pristis pectinata TaxID=685728 RepID=UPI00223CEEFF|nr:avidin-like [Pristis pectinata]